jgi:thiol-disulfide isomerase/thioredoxin
VRFAHELYALHIYLNDQLYYSPTLLHAVYDLQGRHPSSVHMQFYQPKIDKLKNGLETGKQPFAKAKVIEANFSSFNSLIKRFEGKNLLVDIWATWCHPCIEDFKHKESIHSFMESGQIEVLYVSIDKQQWDDRWRQSIKINALEGNQFRASTKFILDMWSTIGDLQGAIPRYVLIDKQGQIFRSTAARPSKGTELVKQIELLLHDH